MKTVNVLFFATLRTHMGTRQVSVELPEEAGIPELKAHLAASTPGVEDVLDYALVAINREYASAEASLPDGAEVAFFPHVSGG